MLRFELAALQGAHEPQAARAAIREAFIAYSQGRAQIPPVGELHFAEPPGECHIKYGSLEGFECYVVKIASGFYENPKRGLPSSDGLMLAFSRSTGQPVALFQDRGWMTDIRTAIAGSLASELMAEAGCESVTIFGTGIQARLQLRALLEDSSLAPTIRRVTVWARSEASAGPFEEEMRPVCEARKVELKLTREADAAAASSRLLVCCTPSTKPLFSADAVQPGTHVTALGSDTPTKQELPGELVAKAQVVVDSRSQCALRGEVARAIHGGHLNASELERIPELGEVLESGFERRKAITVADLTGVAVQDIAIVHVLGRALGGEAWPA